MKAKFFSLLFVCVCCMFSSCSGDDENEMDCLETNFSLVVNGELIQFGNGLGYGINWDWENGGHILHMSCQNFSNEISQNKTMFIKLRHKRTGKNIIEEFYYSDIVDENGQARNLVEEGLQSDVIINRSTCFHATFSGTFNVGDQQIAITDGKASCIYHEPMDGITIE